jgi:hypothetical protein
MSRPHPWGNWFHARVCCERCAGLAGDVSETGVCVGGMSVFLALASARVEVSADWQPHSPAVRADPRPGRRGQAGVRLTASTERATFLSELASRPLPLCGDTVFDDL